MTLFLAIFNQSFKITICLFLFFLARWNHHIFNLPKSIQSFAKTTEIAMLLTPQSFLFLAISNQKNFWTALNLPYLYEIKKLKSGWGVVSFNFSKRIRTHRSPNWYVTVFPHLCTCLALLMTWQKILLILMHDFFLSLNTFGQKW